MTSTSTSTSTSTPAVGQTRAVTPTTPGPESVSPVTSVEDVAPNELDFTPSEDIAVIGMSCRVPGGSNGHEELWDFLMRKGDACGDMPAFRWEPYHDRNPSNAKTLSTTTSKGYFLDRIEDFDAAFFSVSPREAEQMDPQQRIALEVAWQALEDAGIPPQSLAGTNTAVYMGVNSDDYAKLLLEDLENIGAYMGVGTAYCGIPSRISYLLDLMGPSIAIDAACASSLVAIHQARQAILAGETDLAIAGGVNALIGPGLTRVLDIAGVIAADGKCRSFDDSAHGYGRGEGAGLVVLKSLGKAIASGDHIHAVLKGSAVCTDGKTVGIMAPNAVAQELVAAKALQEAKVPASSILYVEAHATSTPLGDPTETAALARIYGSGVRAPGSERLPIGSIKSNIGHLEAGAGVLSFIKAVMVLEKQVVPPQANLETPSTKIDWDSNMLVACQHATQLERSSTPARAAIASYGYSGTVSHAIIEAAPSPEFQLNAASTVSPALLLLSAPQNTRLPAAAECLVEWLSSRKDAISLQDLAVTLSSRRGHHRFRSAIVANNIDEAITSLQKLASSAKDNNISNGRAMPEADKGHVWVLSGHGSHWPEMGKELYASSQHFRNVVHELEPIIMQELGFSPTKALESGNFEQTDAIQALTFLMHIGIARVLQAESGPPAAIIGHSLGESAAAVISGALTLREGTLLVCKRARLYREVMRKGSMALISLSYPEVITKLEDHDDIDVAIDASPNSCVISGLAGSVDQLCEQWAQEGIQVRKVNSDIAFHSRMLCGLAQALRTELTGILHPRSPTIPLYSTSALDPRSAVSRDVEYWLNNMVQPVLLRSTVEAAAADGFRAFVEVSSHPIVTHSVNETLDELGIGEHVVLPTMLRKKPARSNILNTIGKLHCFGVVTNYTRRSSLPWISGVPGTVWSHQPFWRQVAKVPFGASLSHDPLSNTLLGQRSPIWGTDIVLYQTRLDEANKPFPGKHPLHGSEIVPAAVLINTFLHATSDRSLANVSLKVPVVVSPARNIQVRVAQSEISITSKLADTGDSTANSAAWLVNTTCSIHNYPGLEARAIDLAEIKNASTRPLPDTFSIDYLEKVGVSDMGFPWKVLEHLEGDQYMLARVATNPDNLAGCNDNWTSMLDAATSIASTIFYKDPLLRMPTAIDRVSKITTDLNPQICYIYSKRVSGAVAADVLICDEEGIVLVELQSMAFAGIEGEASANTNVNGLVHRHVWVPATYQEEPTDIKHVAFLLQSLDQRFSSFHRQLSAKGITTSVLEDPDAISDLGSHTAIAFVPIEDIPAEDVFDATSRSCMWLATVVQRLADAGSTTKVFTLLSASKGTAALRNRSIHGLARILISETPEHFGGVIEIEDDIFPFAALRYIRDEPVVRLEDGVARVSRLREYPQPQINPQPMFVPDGTYLITGGLGALGLKVASWMVEQGARRLVLVSRSRLPKRSEWKSLQKDSRVGVIRSLEKLGATVHVLSIDISTPDGDALLTKAIEDLSLPAVRGVVHAAGVLVDQLVQDITAQAFQSVLAPKINGAMNLDKIFPVGSLDFMVLFSSCGQLLGFPGQASYASGNAFLDALATQRRAQGDNTYAIQWTSWRGLGMAASTEYINAELNARGITDITATEAFLAWTKIAALQTDHAVVLRTLPLEFDDPLPHPILSDVITRKAPIALAPGAAVDGAQNGPTRPKTGPELQQHLVETVTKSVASTLLMDDGDVDPLSALAEMGMDSVMTVQFRSSLQSALKVKVPPTLLWKCPTIDRLVNYFMIELAEK